MRKTATQRLGVRLQGLSYTDTLLTLSQKRELGRYACEDCMPSKIQTALENEDDSNKARGVMPKLSELLENDSSVESAYLCSEAAVQVWKTSGEGGTFCGYRNIQMLTSTRALNESSDVFRNVPSIQRAIEESWDNGHNSHCRDQLQGIRNTRKYIGTLEVEALLSHLEVPHSISGYYGRMAYENLLDAIWIYFSSTPIHHSWRTTKVQITEKPPIYLQLPGHSLTVVGVEEHNDHGRRMLVFDPAWKPPAVMRMPAPLPKSTASHFWRRNLILRQYRKPNAYFYKFHAFETVMVEAKVSEDDGSDE